MRVGLDGFPLVSPRTGVGHYTFELARALAAVSADDEFHLIAPVPLPDSIVQEINQDTAANLQLNIPKVRSLRHKWWAAGLPIYLRSLGLDLFHGTNYDVPLLGRDRNILTIHDLSILLHPEFHEPTLARRGRRRLPLMARAASRIITPSESVKREICEHLGAKPENISVTPEAPRRNFRRVLLHETEETRRRLKIEDEFILFVGTIEPRKNLPTLVRAFEEILTTTSLRPQLVIAGGEGWLMEEFLSLAGGAHIRDRLRLTGYIHDEDLRALYSSCRVFVYPSLYEGFGLPPLEAMACGAPVVTSRIPSIVETVGDAASLVDPRNAKELSASIVELLTDENKRRSYSTAGLTRAAGFSWEQTARATLDIYQQVMAKK
ncbi:MAG TPA: glycosyltransferase family 1 protein [Pyrinomonadaceae bacterium]